MCCNESIKNGNFSSKNHKLSTMLSACLFELSCRAYRLESAAFNAKGLVHVFRSACSINSLKLLRHKGWKQQPVIGSTCTVSNAIAVARIYFLCPVDSIVSLLNLSYSLNLILSQVDSSFDSAWLKYQSTGNYTLIWLTILYLNSQVDSSFE